MPIDDLASVIETLQQRIQQHAPSLRENEIRTRIALIDPLLRALGWDVSDPALVTPEYTVSGGRVDYALLGADGKPVALLEAKHLNEALTAHRMQMVNYANMSGVPYAGLTDGSHWELYEVFAQKPFEERHLLRVSIADTPAYQCALPMLLLWRPNLASGQPAPASAPILAALPETPPTPMPDAVPAPVPTPTAKPPLLPAPLVTPATETQPPLGWAAPVIHRLEQGYERPPVNSFPRRQRISHPALAKPGGKCGAVAVVKWPAHAPQLAGSGAGPQLPLCSQHGSRSPVRPAVHHPAAHRRNAANR